MSIADGVMTDMTTREGLVYLAEILLEANTTTDSDTIDNEDKARVSQLISAMKEPCAEEPPAVQPVDYARQVND